MTTVAVVLVVTAVVAPGVGASVRRRPVRRRVAGMAPVGVVTRPWARRRAGATGSGAPPGAPVGVRAGLGRLGAPLRRLAHRPPDPDADVWVGGVALLGGLSAVAVGVVVALVLVGAALAVPALSARRRTASAERSVRRVLPDVVDLFRLAVGAGLSVHQAVDAVAARAADPVGPALQEVRRRVALGERLGDALDALAVLGDPARPLVAALTGAARYGTPLGRTLERVGEDARMLRRRHAEERARKLPVQLLFPLVTCVLPAFGLLAVVPLLAGSLPALSGEL